MQGIEAGWWLLFFGAFGLCLGSFLNVVIYRIPRDISLREPRWSFCPGCLHRIAWYDNLPLFSYIQLGGNCRSCGMRISPRYPLIEILGALTTLILFDAFFIAHSHSGIGGYFVRTPVGATLTWQVSDDWPIYLAHVVLFGGLLAMSAIDIEYYWVDVRFTWCAAFAGFVLHAIWSPPAPDTWVRPGDAMGAAALAATATLALTALIFRARYHDPGCDHCAHDEHVPLLAPIFAGAPGAIADHEEESPEPPPTAPRSLVAVRIALWAAGLMLLLLVGGAWLDAIDVDLHLPPIIRWAPVFVLFFCLIVAGGMPRRHSDSAILAAIEAERHSARRVALGEAAMLLPAIAIGVAVWYAVTQTASADTIHAWLHWSPNREWHPVQGLATAAVGFIIGGGIGWLVRIVATLIMGREAFGTGDIHMMAAAGCVAGWPVVLIGFVLCSFLALLGWLLLVPFKRARAIPLGPWLSIAFLIVVVLYGPIVKSHWVQNVVTVFSRPAETIHNVSNLPFTPLAPED
ncbi:MAG: prepilin peptidase [Phycisphaerales bacterium]|nr:prepilin peptidase [Phycisphaerales bacterium]